MSVEELVKEFVHDTKNERLSFVVSKWMFDRIPYIFHDDNQTHIRWKEELASKIDTDSREIALIGSSCMGFSLNPNKNFKPFNENSDVDVAIISRYHFDVSWRYLSSLGTQKYKLTKKQQYLIKEHQHRLIYWGTIATDSILEILPFKQSWTEALLEMSKYHPTIGLEINARIYRDFAALRSYQMYNIGQLRDKLLSTEIGV